MKYIFIKNGVVTIDEFIFSNKRADRLKRHLAFWGVYCLISFFANIEAHTKNDFFQFTIYKYSLINVACFFPSSIFFVYIFIYVLIPKFIKSKKYATFIAAAFAAAIFFFIADYFLSRLYFNIITPGLIKNDLLLSSVRAAYRFAIQNGLELCGCAVGIKLAKEWYLQQRENTLLGRQRTENKLKLLKSHLRPEFLFHSLKNLHKKIDQSADEAPEMVLHLSEIFSYILYDCEHEKTALNKELSAIQQLIIIEKMNKGNSLKINTTVNGNSDDKNIPPLLLFSVLQHIFMENQDTENYKRSIDINIDIQEQMLYAAVQINYESGNDTIKLKHPEVVTSLQQNLPAGYLEYEEENCSIIASIILFGCDAGYAMTPNSSVPEDY